MPASKTESNKAIVRQFFAALNRGDVPFIVDEQAIVEFPDKQYRLPRRSSNITIKYATDQATLYLDGDFAAFIAEDRPLPGCVLTPGKRG